MNQKQNILEDSLNTFDSLELDNLVQRRMAFKPLYDFFQILIKEVGVNFLGLDANSMRSYHLKTRWENTKIHLAMIEDPKSWDGLINEVYNIRSKVEHNEYHDPNASRLKIIRKKAPEFYEWIIKAGKEYYRKSKNFTFKQSFFSMLDWYVKESEIIFREFGDNPPYVAKKEYPSLSDEEPYEELKEVIKVIRERLSNFKTDDDFKRSDLDNLVNVVKIITEIRARETMLLKHSICPKCGGKIIESEKSYGYEDQGGVIYRVGCEKCDYEIHSESFDY